MPESSEEMLGPTFPQWWSGRGVLDSGAPPGLPHQHLWEREGRRRRRRKRSIRCLSSQSLTVAHTLFSEWRREREFGDEHTKEAN